VATRASGLAFICTNPAGCDRTVGALQAIGNDLLDGHGAPLSA